LEEESWLNGSREVSTLIYEINSFPLSLIAPATLQFIPQSDSEMRRLWLSTSVSVYEMVKEEIEKFCLEEREVEMKGLVEMNRFRIKGYTAFQAITSTFISSQFDSIYEAIGKYDFQPHLFLLPSSALPISFSDPRTNQTPTNLDPPNTEIRRKKKKKKPHYPSIMNLEGSFYDPDSREKVVCPSDHEMNGGEPSKKKRNHWFHPSSSSSSTSSNPEHIPTILIFKDLSSPSSTSIDILIPSGWGRVFLHV